MRVIGVVFVANGCGFGRAFCSLGRVLCAFGAQAARNTMDKTVRVRMGVFV